MANDPRAGDNEMDSVALEEWVERTAEGKDEPPQVIIDRMISSYWILEELMRMAADPDSDDNGEEDDHRTQERTDVSEDDVDAEELAEFIKGIKSLQETAGDGSETGPVPADQGPTLDISGDERASVPAGSPAEFLTVVLDLRDRIDDLSRDLEELKSEQEATADRSGSDLDDSLAELESRIADTPTRSDFDALLDAVDEELEEFEASLRQFEGRIAQLEEAEKESTRSRQEIKQSHSELENRIEREFDSIEAVLRNVLDTSDDLDYRIGSLADSHQEDVEPLEEHTRDHQRLTELKREAQRKDISEAVCGYCDADVDLRLLEEPYCHDCRHRLTGITEASWVPFRKPELQTTSTQKDLREDSMEGFDSDTERQSSDERTTVR